MTPGQPTADSLTIVLLCTQLPGGKQSDTTARPLTLGEWNELAQQLLDLGQRPAVFLGRTLPELQDLLPVDRTTVERIFALISRGPQFAIELERLRSEGIWVLTRADEIYPARLRQRLGKKSPAVLFGAGPVSLLSAGGVAVAGSREAAEEATRFAAELGRACARDHLTVVSGAAKGIDRAVTASALASGGKAIGVSAESLERMLRDRDARTYVMDERLTLVTPFHPSAPFSVGNAMARNKLIYCLADYAVVVASSEGSGGTWAGAVENLKAGWVPTCVRASAESADGNQALVRLGAAPLADEDLSGESSLRAVLEQARAATHPPGRELESPAQPAVSPEDLRAAARGDELFSSAWQIIRPFLTEPKTDAEVAQTFDLELKQARVWLMRAVEQGLAERINKPVRYRAPRSPGEPIKQPGLFG